MRNYNSFENGNDLKKNQITSNIHHKNDSFRNIPHYVDITNIFDKNNPNIKNPNLSDNNPAYKKFSILTDQNKNELSNYLNPIAHYNSHRNNMTHNKSPILYNSGNFSLQNENNFIKNPQFKQSGKNDLPELNNQIIPNRLNVEGNNKYFRNNVLIEHSNNEANEAYFKHVTKISRDCPDWFKINDRSMRDKIDNYYIQDNQSLHVLSRFKDWITITPKSKNRRKPLEKEKLTSLENSKICPIWMQINPKTEIPHDIFKPIQFTSLSDNIKKTILVDKNQKY